MPRNTPTLPSISVREIKKIIEENILVSLRINFGKRTPVSTTVPEVIIPMKPQKLYMNTKYLEVSGNIG
jgi:hypothetical protein